MSSNRDGGAPLGQHFLASRALAREMVGFAGVRADSVVVEIGPGKGVLTEALLAVGAHVIAIEKDPILVAHLAHMFSRELKEGQLLLHESDVRDASIHSILPAAPYALIANIPYYITGAILRLFLSLSNPPQKTVLMVQKEVAERIVARNGKESMLSLSVKLYGAPRIVKKIPARYFTPPPRVDSAILAIDWSGAWPSSVVEETLSCARSGFAQKRKRLAGNLSRAYGAGIVMQAFSACGIPPDVRAENVNPNAWVCLSRALTAASRF